MDFKPPPRRMADYVWFRVPGKLPEQPAPFFLGKGHVYGPGYATHRVRQEPLPDKMVLSIALTRGGQASVDGQVRNLKQGHAVFHLVHDRDNWFGVNPQHQGDFEYLGYMFEGRPATEAARTIRERYPGPYLLDLQNVTMRRLLSMTKERSHYVTLSASEAMSLSFSVLAMVLHAAEAEVHMPQTRELAERAEALMREQPALDWTVSDLAERCGVSREHLTRSFSQKYGVSPSRYLSELRIQQACSRLRGTEEPIKNIMLDLGFTSHATFTRAFRRYTNTTPSEYRVAGGL